MMISPDIVRYRKGSKKHLDDTVSNSDFPGVHCLGIRLSASGIALDCIGKYMIEI